MIPGGCGCDGFLIEEGEEHRSFGLAVTLAEARAENFDALF